MKPICAVLLFHCCFCTIFSQNANCLDPTLGVGGVLKFEPGVNYEAGNGIAFQADGKMIVCSEAEFSDLTVQLRRFQLDGSIDTTFGTRGTVAVSTESGIELAGDVIVLPNGKIAASLGHFSDLHKIYMFHPNGSPDLSFGQNGVYSIPGTSVYETYNASLSLLPDGKFVATNNGYEKLTLVRFNADGSLDATFGTGGVAVTNFPEYPFARLIVKALETAADGSVFVGGRLSQNNDLPFFLMKFKPNGSLDNSFGDKGRIVQSYAQFATNEVKGIQLLSDGSIVALWSAITNTQTQFFLSKYQPNGAVFSSFGQNGSVQESYATTQAAFNDLMLLPNGNLLVGGHIGADMVFMQYTAAGQRLGTYGNNGTLKINFGPVGSNECRRFARNPTNSKICAVGYTVCSIPEDLEYVDRNDVDIALVRLNADGNLDNGFGQGGRMKSFINNPVNKANGLALQSDGKFMTVSSSLIYGTILMRFFSDGTPDRSFGNFGKVHLGLIVSEEGCIKINNGRILLTGKNANNLVVWRLLNDGTLDLGFGTKGVAKLTDIYTEGYAVETVGNKIIVSGCANCLDDASFLVAQFNENGTLDASFGTSGKTIVPFGTGRDIGKFLKIRSNGKIVVAGQTEVSFISYPALLQLNPNGTLDASFGTNGKVTLNALGKQGFVRAMALLPDGKIILTDDTDLFATQFLENGALDLSFSKNGWMERFDIHHSNPVYSNTLTTLGGRVYYGGNTSVTSGVGNAVMIARSSPNGAFTSPCGTQSSVLQADIFSGYSEEIKVLKADSDHSMLVFGTYVPDPGISGNTHLFVTRFVPEPPVALYPIPAVVNVTPDGTRINSLYIAGECEQWTITENSPWILSVSPSSGSGAELKDVYVYCTPNPQTTPRTATLNISGCGTSTTVTVVQAGVVLTASPLSFSVTSSGGAALLDVIGTCGNWTISETASWISIDPSSGSQSKQVTIKYDPNPNSNARSATLRLEGCGVTLNLSFNQAGTSLNFSPTSLSVGATAGTASATVTGTCPSWSISVDSVWLSVSPVQGTQSQTISVTCAENPLAISRTAQIKVTGIGCTGTKTLTVTQAGATLSVSTTSLSVKALPGSETFEISGTCGNWTVGTNVPWLSASPALGGGPAAVAVHFDANLSPDERVGTIIVSGCGILHTITVSQVGAFLLTSNLILSVESTDGEVDFNILGTCNSWAISSNVPWLSTSPVSGSGASSVVLQVENNPGTLERDGKLTISGCGLSSQIIVIQAGANAVLTPSPDAFAVGSTQGTAICSVSGNCTAWTLVSNAGWLHPSITSGSGSAVVSIGFDGNPGMTPRNGTLTLSGCGFTRTISVLQGGGEAPPMAQFSAISTVGCDSLTVHFTNLSSANANSFLWAFPGGVPNTSTAKHPVVFYEKSGKYSASLVAKNAIAETTETKQDFIHVRKSPPKNFTASTTPNASTVQFFTIPSVGTSFFWDFGDGHTAAKTNPSHTYEAGGIYTVAMKANNGCLTEKVKNVNVPSPPPSDDRSNLFSSGNENKQVQTLAFSVAPNPTPDGQVSVRFGAPGKINFELVNASGKIIGRNASEFTAEQLEKKIDFKDLSPGIYWLRASDGQKSGVLRLAVIH